ncbi:lipase maturation factor 2-like [Neocloeon triangulifer]|uniref:lipase maturation factor 2-like n=1 Tax=Neocloeon triangulifer TaxID=2078957 RepID=UPI00286F3120|nr:lipase maturation factor 2-like [Neocloeon triangulifer]
MQKTVYYSSVLFLRCVCFIYLFAFLSIYVQIPGLNGHNGILPACSELDTKAASTRTFLENFLQKPTLLWLAPEIGLNTQYAMELIALLGAILAFLGFVNRSLCTAPFFAILWIFYQSLFQVNPVFFGFQWDILLLELGFLSIIIAPLWGTRFRKVDQSTSIRFWLARWLIFRLMFASGVVKLTSGCPTWWDLTALDVHFESQCIPTPLAWYAHHLPKWFLHLSVLGAHFIECVVPLFFFIPIRAIQYTAFYLQILLQVTIMLTGNYNFFNLITIVLCISLVDDHFFLYKEPTNPKSKKQALQEGTGPSTAGKIICIVLYGAAIFFTGKLFNFKIGPEGTPEFKASFDSRQLKEVLTWFVPLTMVYGFASLACTISYEILNVLRKHNDCFSKLYQLGRVLFYSIIASAMFAISLVPYSVVRPKSHSEPPILTALQPIYAQTYRFHLSSGYGLFRHMTGINGRPEVIIEGSDSLEGPWKEFEFRYKPGDVTRPPPMVAPHQPRLDWQMWFAALGTYHQNPWIVSLAYRLLKGQPEVLRLLDPDNPFKTAPKYIRANLYTYRYTAWENREAWWTRKKESEYFPIFSAEHKPLLEYLEKLNLLNVQDWPLSNQYLVKILDSIRTIFQVTDPVVSIWGIGFAAFAIIFT